MQNPTNVSIITINTYLIFSGGYWCGDPNKLVIYPKMFHMDETKRAPLTVDSSQYSGATKKSNESHIPHPFDAERSVGCPWQYLL